MSPAPCKDRAQTRLQSHLARLSTLSPPFFVTAPVSQPPGQLRREIVSRGAQLSWDELFLTDFLGGELATH